ncbi:iron-sulfur cluster assembly accessory protein [Cronbergia sp. UHCC 0137]|uniref:HesB/IscA family protein n=1 Tax=Cronbergia sp. UHCC 0137 TaxID=3110239 RepID=UPI002B1ED75A|nr:iron-sulfur cluster assembly accessory protein [Cronbergia sp. UHCC 0137]MEA5619846.1 iron-sulfur cluster assembly accessory protein [Cronbergia sp. UHCC 0137]
MIHLSPAATNEIERLKSKQQPNVLFRLQVKAGGCVGWFYDISFDQATKVEDQVFEVNGISVIIDPQTLNYVSGLTLDYSEDLMGGGFRFNNPKAIATCSCGNSFSMDDR